MCYSQFILYSAICVMPNSIWKQRLHGQEQNLAFSPKPSCRPDNVAHMRRNHWLPVKAGSSNGVITVRDNAKRCTFLSASSSLSTPPPALSVAQHCPLLSAAFTTLG